MLWKVIVGSTLHGVNVSGSDVDTVSVFNKAKTFTGDNAVYGLSNLLLFATRSITHWGYLLGIPQEINDLGLYQAVVDLARSPWFYNGDICHSILAYNRNKLRLFQEKGILKDAGHAIRVLLEAKSIERHGFPVYPLEGKEQVIAIRQGLVSTTDIYKMSDSLLAELQWNTWGNHVLAWQNVRTFLTTLA